MNPRVLIIITSDPRKSGRPAEAIRIAAGVSAWKKTEISVYLRDAAVLALSENCSDFVNGENYTRYLPMLLENGCPIYVQQGNSKLANLGDCSTTFKEVSDSELAKVAAKQTYVMRF